MSSLRISVPPAAAAELRRWTLDDFQELRELRAALRLALGDQDDLCDRIAVVATELATNALRHGLPPTVVRLMRQGDRLIVDVADHDLAASPEPADRPLGEGGLGLRLAQTFAADVGWYIADETKHVWASFPG
nr:ATP-binding protein [uncultured Actinoplanes sp.]